MNITVKQLRIFTEVARQLSFAGAANQLHLSQPAITLAVQNLELHIGGKLFDRNTRRLELTPEGELFYPTAIGLLSQWTEAIEDVHNLFTLQRGRLNMAVMPSFGTNAFPDILAQYHDQFPDINLAIEHTVMDKAIEHVKKGRCELAVIFAGQNMKGVEFTPLFNDCFMAIYSDKHKPELDARNLTEDWSPLFELPMVMMDRDSSLRHWIEDEMGKQSLQASVIIEVDQIEALGRYVAKGMGVGIVPSLCKDQMASFGLNMQPLNEDYLSRQVGMVTPHNQSLSVAAQAMIRVLKQHYQPV